MQEKFLPISVVEKPERVKSGGTCRFSVEKDLWLSIVTRRLIEGIRGHQAHQ